MGYRVGIGYDVHRLEEDVPFWLGGVQIHHSKGATGHSDGDVLLHAICDALLGAAALGDIGVHFPDTDPDLHGIASSRLLERTVEMVRERGFKIQNVDSTICLQQPRIQPHIRSMRENIAKAMLLEPGRVSVKATTEEKLGFTGREEGVSATAVVLLEESG